MTGERNWTTITYPHRRWDLGAKNWFDLTWFITSKTEKLLFKYVFSLDLYTHVTACALSSFHPVNQHLLLNFIFVSVPSIRKVIDFFCNSLLLQVTVFSPATTLRDFLPITPSLIEAILKSLESLKWNSWQLRTAVDPKCGCGEVFQECSQCLGQGSQGLTRPPLGFWTAAVKKNGLVGSCHVCYHFLS